MFLDKWSKESAITELLNLQRKRTKKGKDNGQSHRGESHDGTKSVSEVVLQLSVFFIAY